MNEIIKPVRYGILIGLFGLVFGIGWAFWLVLGHEKIHEQLEQRAAEKKEAHSFIQLLEPDAAHAHTKEKKKTEEMNHSHMEGMGAGKEDEHQHSAVEEQTKHFEGGHDSPLMELAHKRLSRGHLHAMGLGLVTIVLSLVLAFTGAPDRIKTAASVLTGLGGLIYPFAWIAMGYRTPALGPDAAEASVTIIAGPGVAFVLLGIFTAGLFLLKDVFSRK